MNAHTCETVLDLQRQLAELRAHNAKLTSDIEAHEHINRQLVEDKRRLDWLEITADGINWQLNNTNRITRAAIDAARKEK